MLAQLVLPHPLLEEISEDGFSHFQKGGSPRPTVGQQDTYE